MVVLNSNCSEVGGCAVGLRQVKWLRADLAAHPTTCTLAYWHAPLYSSGEHGNNTYVRPFWRALYEADADVVLSDHDYETFAPQDPYRSFDSARGIREFVVGTGGKSHYPCGNIEANSRARNANTYGVLKLTLHPVSFTWKFVPQSGKTFTDSGTAACH